MRTAAGLFDLSHMGEIRDQRARTPPRSSTTPSSATCRRLRFQGARYTMICAEDGGVVDDLIVYRDREDALPRRRQRLEPRDRARRRCAERTARVRRRLVEDRSPQTALIAVQGPNALDIVRATEGLDETGGDIGASKYYACLPATFAGRAGPRRPHRLHRRGRLRVLPRRRAGPGPLAGVPRRGRATTGSSRPACPRATASASRPGCRCTATSSTAPRPRTTPAWAAW